MAQTREPLTGQLFTDNAAHVRQLTDVAGIVEAHEDSGDMTTKSSFTPASGLTIKAVEIAFQSFKPADAGTTNVLFVGYGGTLLNDADTSTKREMILSGERYVQVFETNRPTSINYATNAADAGDLLSIKVLT